MSNHTTFRTGGNADYYIAPEDADDLSVLLQTAVSEQIPFFILGGGANILVADRGIRGLVVDMRNFSGICFQDNICTAGAGASISDAALLAAENSLSGIEFIYGMPGTVGGAVWMNARCYDTSVSDILKSVDYLDNNYRYATMEADIIKSQFGYKSTPFQNSESIILSARFILESGKTEDIKERMNKYKADREQKGHYRFPCAGSVFKNNRNFGRPTGAIIDSLGLKGMTKGNAQIADFHGNIIINRGNATSADIKYLIDYVSEQAERKLGIILETEVQLVGDW